MIPDPKNAQAFNRYSYTINNPIAYVDPNGHSWESALDFLGINTDSLPEPVNKQMYGEMEQTGEAMTEGTTRAGTVLGSMVPGVGEAMDAAIFFDENASFLDVSLAGGSLLLSILTEGLSPNYGALKGGAKGATNNIQSIEGRSPWTSDLTHVTGKGAKAKNKSLDAIIKEDLSSLKLTHKPQYSPFASQGVAKKGSGTQVDKNAFNSRNKLRTTIVHEELHHRWW